MDDHHLSNITNWKKKKKKNCSKVELLCQFAIIGKGLKSPSAIFFGKFFPSHINH